MPDLSLVPGSFFAVVPHIGALPTFLSFGRSSLERVSQSRVTDLLRNSPAPSSGDALSSSSYNSSPEVYKFGSGVSVVVHGSPVHGSSSRLYSEPATAADGQGICVLVPGSYISNAEELLERLEENRSPRQIDARAECALLVLRLFRRDPDPLLVLSELQGTFSFFLYDVEHRAAFVARDASGSLPLYYEIDDNGGISVASAPMTVPSAHDGHTVWEMLPPGRYIAGRPPRVLQFALTQEEMVEREALEESLEDECISPRHSEAGGQRLSRRLSAGLSSWGA